MKKKHIIESAFIKDIGKLWSMGTYEINILKNRCYPDFVFDRGIKTLKNEIPVFLFHSAESGDFEEKLAYLAANGYKTIKADELYDYLTGKRKNAEKTVMLTFDDGRGSLWTVAYPLLKKYGLIGVAFIVPNLIKEGDGYYPNLDDYWNGTSALKEIENREYGPCPYITWKEVREMHRSGTIDFQSHTLNHSMVFTSDVLIDFINPRFNFGFYNDLVPVCHVNGGDSLDKNHELGAPVYTMMPRASGARRYFDDEYLRKECTSYVEKKGGDEFFKRLNWRRQLKGVVDEYRERNVLRHRYESDVEREEMILYEFRESKAIIENHIPGKSVNHLCYPYFAGSDLSIELSKKSGYLGNFWGWDVSPIKNTNQHTYINDPYLVGYQMDSWIWDSIGERRNNRPGDDPYKIVRLPGDYIFCLPGKGRRSISRIIAMKCLRGFKKNLKEVVSV